MKIFVKFEKKISNRLIIKVPAIKLVRSMSGCSLKEAKDCVEAKISIDRTIDTNNPWFNYDSLAKDMSQIRKWGGTVITGDTEWLLYEDDINEMLLVARIKGHTSMIDKLTRLKLYVDDANTLNEMIK